MKRQTASRTRVRQDNTRSEHTKTDVPEGASVLQRVVGAVKLLFTGHVRLQGKGLRKSVALAPASESPASKQSKHSRHKGGSKRQSELDESNSTDESTLMRLALRELLDRQAGARRVLKHLAAIEKLLKHKGVGALSFAPQHFLTRALAQLDTLVNSRSPQELQRLRARMQEAVANYRRETGRLLSDFNVDAKVQVAEVNESVFEEAHRRWSGADLPVMNDQIHMR